MTFEVGLALQRLKIPTNSAYCDDILVVKQIHVAIDARQSRFNACFVICARATSRPRGACRQRLLRCLQRIKSGGLAS